MKRILDKDVLPRWWNRPIEEIGRADVIELLDAVQDRGSPIMARRMHAQTLAEERRLLKEERATRQARAQQPGPTALEKLVRTHHPEAKEKPKATKEAKEAKEPKDAKTGKRGPTRAEKHAAKAAALDAARRAKKKSAKP